MISISHFARQRLINIIKHEGKSALLYVKGAGCNGYSYEFEILKENKKPNALDEVFSLENNYNLYLCNKSFMWLLDEN